MGWFRDLLSSQATAHEQQQHIDGLTADLNEARRERQDAWNEQGRLRDRANELVAQNERLAREVVKLTELSQAYFTEKRLLVALLEDARTRDMRHAALTERVVTVERQNATAQASTTWAIAHINMLTAERGALLEQRGTRVPVPELHWQDPEAPSLRRGAPAQPFDTLSPPPGPIQAGPSIQGVPIPDGQTVGDVLERLRASRDVAEASAPATPEDLLRSAADIFSDLEYPGPGDAPNTPFTE